MNIIDIFFIISFLAGCIGFSWTPFWIIGLVWIIGLAWILSEEEN